MRVLVTPTSLSRDPDAPALRMLHAAGAEVRLNPHGRPLTEDELIAAVRDVDAVVAGLDPYTARVIAAAPRLRVIARYGTGTDRVDLAAAHAAGVVVANTPGANALAVAEFTIGLVFAVARDIPRLDALVREGEWPRGGGRELNGRTFGIVGFGAIGRLVAARARGIGMGVVAYDPLAADEAFAAAGVERLELDELCRRSDVVSLHVPLLAETRHLLDERRLGLLPPEAIVVNTARGGLLDEVAARQALDSGRLHGVAIDVYETEPPSASPLLGHPRVIATPHAGGHTREAVERMSQQAIAAVLAVLRGEEPPHRVV